MTDYVQPFERFLGKRGLVMGLGVFGGGTESAKFLAGYCSHVVVTDLRGEDVLRDSIDELRALSIEYRLGEHREEDFRNADVVIHSPAVRPDNRYLQIARESGAEVTMEMSLFIEACPGRTVGVTGSNGKTTTALLAYEMLCQVMWRAQPELEGKWAEPPASTPATSGRVWLGGNCGEPLINRLAEMSAEDVVVLELSSFQLQDWHRIRKSCDVSLITNITPNHLDWHKDIAEYAWAKSAIYRYSPLEGAIFFDGPGTQPLVAERIASGSTAWMVSESEREQYLSRGTGAGCFALIASERGQPVLCRVHQNGSMKAADVPFTPADLSLPGRFNWQNFLCALALVYAGLGQQVGPTLKSLGGARRFRGVEHRLEFCGEVHGARCFNDSIATTPESTMAALSAFDTGVHLLLGGSDKGLGYGPMAAAIAAHPGVRGLYLQGANLPQIKSALTDAHCAHPIHEFATFDQACEAAFHAVKAGDVFLMSPASASFYEYAPNTRFTNFEHRGRHFKALVKAHTT
ncbi:MAG: UDP-N-acetylmuramoyl-L-alanine--D-glutamate ligase [Planctomycetes bacterium]|nr:UDP-N-acetylmuramoyl-L-alanine--D-glutamate ligase [Planctomycetota bacterium]